MLTLESATHTFRPMRSTGAVSKTRTQSQVQSATDHFRRLAHHNRLDKMPFCGYYVRYNACVPKYAPLAPTRDYPNGRWYNNTILHKDQWVQQFFTSVSSECSHMCRAQ